MSSELCISLHPPGQRRVQGRPGGRMHPGPPRKRDCASAREPQVQRRHSGLPCAAVYGLLRALLGEPAFATVAFAKRWASLGLGACMGAPGPHGFAVRVRAARQSAQFTSAAFRSTFVTIAIRPLCRCGVSTVNHNLRKNETRIFLGAGLDKPNPLDAAWEIRFLAQADLAHSLLSPADNRFIWDGLMRRGEGADDTARRPMGPSRTKYRGSLLHRPDQVLTSHDRGF